MPCYKPLKAWRDKATGSLFWSDRGIGDEITLPCSRCIGCRLERSRQWATRIMFEAQLHKQNSFLTLTYADDKLPYPPSLRYQDFQLFMKRLRADQYYSQRSRVRFYMCGEYGSQTFRPHYHACIFGEDFSEDRVFWKNLPSGHPLYRSARLETLWPHGHSSIGELTFESAAYVARYIMKKITGDMAEQHYRFLDEQTGEITMLTPEFCKMSLKPGIGGRWFEMYMDDVYKNHDYVVVNGHKVRPPRYFDRLLRRRHLQDHDELKTQREYSGYQNRADNTDQRLQVKETVKRAQLRQLPPRNEL